jgi:hypothetical protein
MKRRPLTPALFPLALLLLAGCDRGFVGSACGAATTAALTTQPDLPCVEAALRAVEGAGAMSDMATVTPAPDRVVYAWSYGGVHHAHLAIERSGSKLRYVNGNMVMGDDHARGRAFEPLMRRVNARVEQRCGLPIAKAGRI